MVRTSVLAYGAISYAIFFATFLYAIGFIVGFGAPVTLDSAPRGSFGPAVAIDLALLGLFAIQHSVMARPTFKRWWTRIVPAAAERSTYTLFSSLALIALYALWQPIGGVVWSVSGAGRLALYALGGAGWAIVLLASFLINHFDLFGLRQSWLFFRGREYTRLVFKTPWLYSFVRHPLYVGWLMAFWFTPTMTVAHLVFAMTTTLYILVAIQLEERNLVQEHGESYRSYRRRVPMLIPFTRRRAAA
ncbi:MAG: isoprenylcysteine carboxylmethyltransferase family protein [Phycisphaerales bacterium]|nr:isoprenylcysteine carboxylmethyltransferase family protein [Phycisphaerales bacterium]